MSKLPNSPAKVIAYTLDTWEHTRPYLRLVSPWQHAGAHLLQGSRWDQVDLEGIDQSHLVILHRDFPRLIQAYHTINAQARSKGKPVLLDVDDLLLELPDNHPEREHHYIDNALFPLLQAITEVDAVTVSTRAIQKYLQGLNPNIWLLPTYLDDRLWPIKEPSIKQDTRPLVIGYIHDRDHPADADGFASAIENILRRHGNRLWLRVWGGKPPPAWLDYSNLDWTPEIPLDYTQFVDYFSKQVCDIYLSPRGQSRYHRSQSPLRFLEHSACGVPGVYSRIPPYEDLIVHGENGLLASSTEEWDTSLEQLIQSADLRSSLAQNAQQGLVAKWGLSNHYTEWQEIYHQSKTSDSSRRVDDPAIQLVTRVSEQVQHWQRDLQSQISNKDWEVRALNVMMKRKEKVEIGRLQYQLDALLNSNSWRFIQKINRLRSAVSPRKRANKPLAATGAQETPAQPEKTPEQAGQNRQEEGISDLSASVVSEVAPAERFDVIFFGTSSWNNLTEAERWTANQFAQQGSRVFHIYAGRPVDDRLELSSQAVGIYSVPLPVPENASNDSNKAECFPIIQQSFQKLQVEANIFEAISWVKQHDWIGTAFYLRNVFRWPLILDRTEPVETGSDLGFLLNRCDLLLPLASNGDDINAIQDSILTLYPQASIVILTYNNLDYTRQCLESIYAKTIYPNFEVVIVDNASTDETPSYLRDFAASQMNVKLILNAENRGFAGGNNQGVEASSGEYVVYLNNDTIITPGWLSRLIGHLRDPEVGAVGPVTNFSGNESRISVDYASIKDLDTFAKNYTQAHHGETFDISMLALYCMAMRRPVIQEVGPLDERFGTGMYEDDDYSLRIRQKGYRILCAEDVYIHHWGSASFSQIETERYQHLHMENRQKFEEKWGTRWEAHRWRMDEP